MVDSIHIAYVSQSFYLIPTLSGHHMTSCDNNKKTPKCHYLAVLEVTTATLENLRTTSMEKGIKQVDKSRNPTVKR